MTRSLLLQLVLGALHPSLLSLSLSPTSTCVHLSSISSFYSPFALASSLLITTLPHQSVCHKQATNSSLTSSSSSSTLAHKFIYKTRFLFFPRHLHPFFGYTFSARPCKCNGDTSSILLIINLRPVLCSSSCLSHLLL